MSILGLDVGLREDVAASLKTNVRHLLMSVLTDEQLHAEIVAAGRTRFRNAFNRDMGVFFAKSRSGCDDLAEAVFKFAEHQWRARHPHITAAQWLDAYAPPSPLTEAEIDDAWEIEIGSSDAAMRQMYDGSARTRKGKDLGGKRVH